MKLCLLVAILALSLSTANASSPPVPPDPTVQQLECAMCSLVVQEIEGLGSESISEEALAKLLQTKVCPLFAEVVQEACDFLSDNVKELMEVLDGNVHPGVVCVDLDLCKEAISLPPDNSPMPTYEVDLDKDPEDRWSEIVMVDEYYAGLWVFWNTMSSVVSPLGAEIFTDAYEELLNFMSEPYKSEIVGLASSLGLPKGFIAFLNLYFETSQACTSIVAQNADGQIFLSRNQDLGFGMGFTNFLRNQTAHIRYLRNGTLAYEAVTFIGYVGVPTAHLPQKWAASLNAREQNGLTRYEYAVNAIKDLMEDGAGISGQLLRTCLEEGYTYQETVDFFSNTSLIANIYVIIGGVEEGEGRVLSRNQTHLVGEKWAIGEGEWYLAQTNYDHWVEPPFYDNRRYYANAAMKAYCGAPPDGEQPSPSALFTDCIFETLSTIPVRNRFSLYTASIFPATGNFSSVRRSCPGICAL